MGSPTAVTLIAKYPTLVLLLPYYLWYCPYIHYGDLFTTLLLYQPLLRIILRLFGFLWLAVRTLLNVV